MFDRTSNVQIHQYLHNITLQDRVCLLCHTVTCDRCIILLDIYMELYLLELYKKGVHRRTLYTNVLFINLKHVTL